MEAMLAEITSMAQVADQATRKNILDQLRNLAFTLESPGDTVQRLLYLVVGARIANDVNLFVTLVESDTPMSTEHLATSTQVAPALMRRLLRYLASVGMVKEVAENVYAPTNLTPTLIQPGVMGGINFGIDVMFPCLQQLPSFLAAKGYDDIKDGADCAFQRGLDTNEHAVDWIHSHPQQLADFTQWMISHHEGMPTWLTVYPLKEESLGFDTTKPLFVDVGGGVGHQCLAVQNAFPKWPGPGRIVLQDLGPTLQHALPMENIEINAHDFFTPQPIKGARFYYMRNVLHNHPDSSCQIILRQTVGAMNKDSMILIDEMVLSDTGAHWEATQLDIWMMASLNAMERTKKQWCTLLESVGLKLKKIYTYTDLLKDSIIVAVVA